MINSALDNSTKKRKSLAATFRRSFVLIVVFSLISTIITYLLSMLLFNFALNSEKINPANYYENKIPVIEKYVESNGIDVLKRDSETELKNIVKGYDFFYQVVDINNKEKYTNFDKKVFNDKSEFQKSINKTISKNNYYVNSIPIFDKEGKLEGAVLIMYKISLIAANSNKILLRFISIFIILVPFLYIILFTIILSKRITKKISRPINILVDGTNKIKEKNLDFDLDYDEDDELGDLCKAFSDMKDELKDSLSKQWQLEQDRVEMVSSLAHDLKSPLSIIKIYSEAILDDNNINDDTKEYIEVIEKNIDKSISLVQQMQYTSEIDNSKLEIKELEINIREFLEEKIEEYKLKANQKKASVGLCVSTDVPEVINVDVEKLERILDNVVSNSIQYIDFGGKVEVSARFENDKIIYSVIDDGVGFDKEDIDKAFDKFYRGDKARQGVHSGLGLYISKQLCEILGGEIKIFNVEKGSKIEFSHKI